MQGWRLKMEDSHISCDVPSQPDHLFLAVFDGHAGDGAAKYAASNLVHILENNQLWKDYTSSKCESIQLLGEALSSSFLNIDEKIKLHQGTTNGVDTSGCTAVTAMITPKYIICANSGDSRCVLGVSGIAKPLSDDHKPYNKGEKSRIDKAGGFVQWNRVDGDLAVSRAFGDFGYKNRPDLPAKEQKVSCFPDITIHERTGEEEFLLLACDGLWDVMSNVEAIENIRNILTSGEKSAGKITEEMLDLSLEKGSKDNISAVLALLPAAKFGPTLMDTSK